MRLVSVPIVAQAIHDKNFYFGHDVHQSKSIIDKFVME